MFALIFPFSMLIDPPHSALHNCPDQHNPLPEVALLESLAECVGWGQWTPMILLGMPIHQQRSREQLVPSKFLTAELL